MLYVIEVYLMMVMVVFGFLSVLFVVILYGFVVVCWLLLRFVGCVFMLFEELEIIMDFFLLVLFEKVLKIVIKWMDMIVNVFIRGG